MNKITRNTILSVSQLPIVDVISSYITLSKNGSVYKSCCPFHREKTPSFVVNPNKNYFKCFGCGKGGDVITFVSEFETLSFYETIKVLCDKYKIDFVVDGKEEDDSIQKEVKVILDINKSACEFFASKLPNSKSLEILHKRGYSDDTINLFQLGHTSSLFSQLYKHLISVGYNDDDIKKSQLVRFKEDGTKQDTFRDRLIFPIHNSIGRVVGFTARRNLESMIPKYINTTENRVFKKSNELFGLFLSKKHIIDNDEAIVVEGSTDVISLYQCGVKNVVGSLGTSFTTEHAKILKRYTNNIVLLYDGDKAGLKAMFRACEELLKEGLFVYICPLPDGIDPDDFVKEHKEQTSSYIQKNKTEFIKYRTSLLKEANILDKVKLSKELSRMINLVPDKNARNILLKEYNKEFGFEYVELFNTEKDKHLNKDDRPIEFHLLRIMVSYMSDWNIVSYFKDMEEINLSYYFLNNDNFHYFQYLLKIQEANVSDLIHNEDEVISKISKDIFNYQYEMVNDEQYDIMSTLYNADLFALEQFENSVMNGSFSKNRNKVFRVIDKTKSTINRDILNLISSSKN